ncbi:MAG TPA: site-specific integrase, partial [Terriglobales bacterium]|nr:site-specific integrase [Terriglobales bacterium]
SKPPYDLVWWLVFETGIRRGELCALNVGSMDVGNSILVVRQSRWLKHITSTKSKRPRVFSLSPELVERLRLQVEGRKADEPLFLTPVHITKKGKRIGGVRLESNNLVKRHLKPILKQLGLEGAAHAFRHGNATVLDGLNAPMAVRQSRLGHVESTTTMNYTHLVSADDRRISSALGSMMQGILDPSLTQIDAKNENGSQVDAVSH